MALYKHSYSESSPSPALVQLLRDLFHIPEFNLLYSPLEDMASLFPLKGFPKA